ncbi:zinc-dependent alcohol dehydrogenase family protein [Altericroceibacterium endophyticum]|nr:NAD(P)-dependent alcohol dehydrogenase [Altericroceibacterium endophyticum]
MLPAESDSYQKLHLKDLPQPEPGPGEVLIRLKAWSINYRDFAVASGNYFGGKLKEAAIPLSDGAGEVAALGEGVTRFAEGDRVQSAFFTDWDDGLPRSSPALGDGHGPGMLAEYVVLPETAVVPMAESLSFAEAACLPCAGVTAWNCLLEGNRPLQPGDKVLVLGTGGVSILALQIARAAGATVIATSSSDAKLEKVKALGAHHTINYKSTPEWGSYVQQEFGGVDKIVEVGGTGTLGQSFQALGMNGEIGLIGVLTHGDPPDPHALMMSAGTLRGIFVGSGAMARKLNATIDANAITPVIGKRFAFDDAIAAYDHAAGAHSFAKTIIEFS